METRTVEQVENWGTRSVADGYSGLRELSDGEFSGAVRAGGAWLFMLNGRIIGIFEGSLDDFEDADGTAYAAPHPSLPLLFSMQERGGETRAKYYTNDTPLSEVDETLSDGKFTGFVELSENVLSGDYYVAYYGGRSLSVAFVGASEQVVTGEEAFERAADEVGIYEVTDVDLEIVDVPEPEDDDESTGDAAKAAGASAGDGSEEPSGSDPGRTATSGTVASDPADSPEEGTGGKETGGGEAESATDESVAGESASERSSENRSDATAGSAGAAAAQPDAEDESAGATADRPDAGGTHSDVGQPTEHEPGDTSYAESARENASETASARSDAAGGDAGRGVNSDRATSPQRTVDPGRTGEEKDSDEGDSSGSGDRTAGNATTADATAGASTGGETDRRETTVIPSLDPDRSDGPDATTGDAESGAAGAKADRRGSTRSTARKQSESGTGTVESQGSNPASGSAASESSTGSSAAGGSSAAESGSERSDEVETRVRKLRKQLDRRKQQVEQLKDRLSTLESERNEFKRERDALRQEVERLEAELEGATSDGTSDAERRLTETEAFDGTNLFVRYESKGEATLDEAADGKVDRGDVNANLRLEHHTQFEADDASVDGEPFETFLTNSFEYEFVSWLVEELLYEIRDTGHRDGLRDLYEAIPKIDRVDLHGSVSAGDADEDTRQESFDVILRDRMGDPLVVADLNDSRDPTTGEMMGSLVDAASGVTQRHDELAGAFQVTESFFEPDALETAEAATSGGFLSREKRASFVKLSRKRGYHLCLVEARGSDFHLNVPEL